MPRLVLVVDDAPVVRQVTCRMLDLAGYSFLTADTATDALTCLKNGQVPDLAILDIRLPDLPGTTLAMRIHEQYPRIPVLFISGWTGEAVNHAHLAALRWEFLQKPYSTEDLLAAVERLLARGDSP